MQHRRELHLHAAELECNISGMFASLLILCSQNRIQSRMQRREAKLIQSLSLGSSKAQTNEISINDTWRDVEGDKMKSYFSLPHYFAIV